MLNVSNILTLIDKSGEDSVNEILSTFVSQNDEVEKFIKEKAINFAKRKWSITYLVSDSESDKLLGIFTIASKAVRITLSKSLSKSVIKKIKEFDIDGQSESEKQTITSTAYLLAQFSKNNRFNREITGEELLNEALNKLIEIQTDIGGKLLWLECEDDNANALAFYNRENYGFCEFAARQSKNDNRNYKQMVKVFWLYYHKKNIRQHLVSASFFFISRKTICHELRQINCEPISHFLKLNKKHML